jgi:arylsulfatase A-like enzyme
MRRVLLSLAALFSAAVLACGAAQRPDDPGAGRPYVVLVALDGFRHDYLSLHDAPNLRELAARGASVQGLVPPFPSLTFPSFYSIATGLYPEHHGIVANAFRDRERGARFSLSNRETVQDGAWWGGEPVWVRAEQQGVATGAFFYPGTEADIGGVRPTEWRTYDESVPYADRVETVLEWLGRPVERRLHLVTLYFAAVDAAGHEHGPESAEVAAAVKRVDDQVGRLIEGIARLPHAGETYVMVLSDHGMMAVDVVETIDDRVALDGVEPLGFGPNLTFYVGPGPDQAERAGRLRDQLNGTLTRGTAYLRAELPDGLHARGSARLGDVIVVARPGAMIRRAGSAEPPAGMHGWDPGVEQMHGMLLVTGPGIAAGLRLPAVEHVDVYPLLERLLRLTPNPAIDGDPDALAGLGM